MKINLIQVRNPYLEKTGQVNQQHKKMIEQPSTKLNATTNQNKAVASNLTKGTIIDVLI